jgi:predicted nuclease of restriction endonuclease-like (RecB) superfamily
LIPETIIYSGLLTEIKNRVRKGQLLANLSANAEMLATYWDIGKLIHERQQQQGWGKGVIPQLAKDLKNDLAEMKGFSVRNIARMVTFYLKYKDFSILPQAVAKLKEAEIWQLTVTELQTIENQSHLIRLVGWAHHIILIQKVKDLQTRFWYMQQTIANG